jgi:hypothetical protein
MAKHSKKMRGGDCGAIHGGGHRSKKGGGDCAGSTYGGGRRHKRTMRGGMGYGFGGSQEGVPIGAPAGGWIAVDGTAPAPGGPVGAGEFKDASRGGNASGGGRRRRGSRKTRRVVKKKSVATIKRLLKAKGLKVSGSRRALTARARKARIPMKGGGAITGTVYGGYVGEGSAGLPSQFAGAHPVYNDVIPTGGYGLMTTESGGAREA